MIISRRIFVFCSNLIFVLLLVSSAWAKPNPPDKWSAESFSDPSYLVKMPESWKKESISKDHKKVKINLDQEMYYILEKPIKKYAKENNLNVDLVVSTCGTSAGMLRRNMIDIGGFCCPPGETDRLPGLRFHTLGITAVAFIVHPSNSVDGISLNQARKIFRGEISRWSELKKADGSPGPNMLIQPIARLHCKTRPGHWRLLLKDEDFFSLRMQEVGVIPDMISQVAYNNNAIGHVAVWLALDYFENKGWVKALKIDGYHPNDLKAVLSKSYPVYKTLGITTWEGKEKENPQARKLAEHIKRLVEGLDSKYGIVPASHLKQAGWKFKGDELIAEPR